MLRLQLTGIRVNVSITETLNIITEKFIYRLPFRLFREVNSLNAAFISEILIQYLWAVKYLEHSKLRTSGHIWNILKSLQETVESNFRVLTAFFGNELYIFAPSSKVIFMWVPGYCGIPGNEVVDKAAKQATHLPRISPGLFLTHTDLSSITKKWHQLWTDQKSSHNKLAIIKPTPIPLPSSNLKSCRLEKIVLVLELAIPA